MLNRNRQIVSFGGDEAYAELFIMIKMYRNESFELCINYEYSDEALQDKQNNCMIDEMNRNLRERIHFE